MYAHATRKWKLTNPFLLVPNARPLFNNVTAYPGRGFPQEFIVLAETFSDCSDAAKRGRFEVEPRYRDTAPIRSEANERIDVTLEPAASNLSSVAPCNSTAAMLSKQML